MQKNSIPEIKRKLFSLGVDGILITDLNNLRYLAGFTGSSGFSIITKKHSIFITDFRYKEQAKREIKGFTVNIESRSMTETIKKYVDQYNIKKLGFEDHNINYLTYKNLLKNNIRLKALSNTVESLRVVKSRKELSFIKTAVRRAENAFKKLLPCIRAGMREQQLAMKLEGLLREEGCKKIPFEVIVASGRKSALPHAKPTSRAIQKGDFVLFDWGGECEGYFSDMTRVIALKGKQSVQLLRIYSVVRNARERAVRAVRSGIKASVIDAVARNFIKREGFDKYFGHGTGHGIGLAVHEKPVISWQSKDMLQEGMVFTLEPGIYLPNSGGVRIEDMVLVKKDRAEVLTNLPRTLNVIG